MEKWQESGTGVHVPKRIEYGQMASKRDRGPARKVSTYNLNGETPYAIALKWEVVAPCSGAWLNCVWGLLSFRGLPFGPPSGWTPKTTSVLIGGRGRWGGWHRTHHKNFRGSGARRPQSDVRDPPKGYPNECLSKLAFFL